MHMQNIESSSNIRAFGHSPATNAMRIQFANGSVYEYTGVPQDIVEGFASAESKGSYFAKNIRGQFEAVKIETPPEQWSRPEIEDDVV
jgi:hypothetical protein